MILVVVGECVLMNYKDISIVQWLGKAAPLLVVIINKILCVI